MKIIEALPPKTAQPRQTLLFSATIPAEVHTVSPLAYLRQIHLLSVSQKATDLFQIASLALDKDHQFISTLTEEDVNVHEHVIQESLIVPNTDVLIGGAEAIFREQSLSEERGGFKGESFFNTRETGRCVVGLLTSQLWLSSPLLAQLLSWPTSSTTFPHPSLCQYGKFTLVCLSLHE